jgi:hypothetical protein
MSALSMTYVYVNKQYWWIIWSENAGFMSVIQAESAFGVAWGGIGCVLG